MRRRSHMSDFTSPDSNNGDGYLRQEFSRGGESRTSPPKLGSDTEAEGSSSSPKLDVASDHNENGSGGLSKGEVEIPTEPATKSEPLTAAVERPRRVRKPVKRFISEID